MVETGREVNQRNAVPGVGRKVAGLGLAIALSGDQTSGGWPENSIADETRRIVECRVGFAMLAGANLVLLPMAGRLVQRFGTVPLVVLACLGLAVGMALAAWTQVPSLFYVAMVVLGLGSALEGPSLSSYTIAHAPNGQYGPTIGAMRFAGDLGFVLGPVLIGAAIDATGVGYGCALWAAAAVLVLIAVLFLSLARESHPGISPQ
jgi:MFS family permease